MSATNYKRYVEETLSLAKSLTIKDEASIIGINQYIESLGYTVTDDPKTWKYYLNVSGNYHFLDKPMTIVSLDSQETIEFKKEVLATHPVTRLSYKVGSSYYNTLVGEYPEQELLIRGIINPIDIDSAIEAPGYKILFIDKSLIEENEYNLVEELQKQISQFSVRWDNPSFRVTDDLYPAAFYSILCINIPLFLFNIRLSNCKTNYVHSFHINEYLKSNSRLDSYTGYLTKKQQLFLYRNIRYIHRNSGKRNTFDVLTQKMLTERGMGLAEFRIQHNLDDLLDNLKPKVELLRKPLNKFHSSYRSDVHTLEEVLYKERFLTSGNYREEDSTLNNSTKTIEFAKRDNLPTKVLESAIIDWTESGPVIKSEFLLNHWAHWSSTSKYNSVVRVTHPNSGTMIELSPSDAFLIFIYAFNKGVNQEILTVPKITARFVRRMPTPSFNELRSICDSKYVSDELVQYAANQNVEDFEIISTESFVEQGNKLYNEFYKYREVYSLQEHFIARGQVQGLMHHLYMTTECPFEETGLNYLDWFNQKGYDLMDLTNLEYETLASDILEYATGVNYADSFNSHEIQKNLVKLVDQLTSYNIQFLRESNVGNILYWDWPTIRLGDQYREASHLERIDILSNIPKALSFYGKKSYYIDLKDEADIGVSTFGKIHILQKVPPALPLTFDYVNYFKLKIPTSSFEIKNVIEI